MKDFIRRFIFRYLSYICGEQAKSLLNQYLLKKNNKYQVESIRKERILKNKT